MDGDDVPIAIPEVHDPIGIDLGTTYSAIAVFRDGKAEILPVDGDGKIASVVYYPSGEGNDPEVGGAAVKQLTVDPERTVAGIKVHMEDRAFVRRVGDLDLTPIDVSADILRRLLTAAEHELHGNIDRAVISVPAYFAETATENTVEAGHRAGLREVIIVKEPTAAAIYYGSRVPVDNQRVLVYDLGGGTFDVSIINVTTVGDDRSYDVLPPGGIGDLGGLTFDLALFNHLAGIIKAEKGLDMTLPDDADVGIRKSYFLTNKALLLEAARQAKHDLTDADTAEVLIPTLHTETGPWSLDVEVTRAQFEELIGPDVDRTIETVDETLRGQGLTKDDIDRILLVGGSTRIPLVVRKVKDYFGRDPYAHANPDHAVALGAATFALLGLLPVPPVEVLERTVHDLGIAVAGVGAMRFDTIIPRGTELPATETVTYATSSDNVEALTIAVYQSRRLDSDEERSERYVGDEGVVYLDDMVLGGIPPAPRGAYKVDVTFTIDKNDVLSVSAASRPSAGEGTGPSGTLTVSRANQERKVPVS